MTSSIVASSCIKVSRQRDFHWLQRPKSCRSSFLKNVYCWWITTDSRHARQSSRNQSITPLWDFATVSRQDTYRLCWRYMYILQMWWIELKYGFYLQYPAYFPRISLWILDKYSSTSFWQRLSTEFYGKKALNSIISPPLLPLRFVVILFCLFLNILFLPIGWFQFVCTAAHLRLLEVLQ